MILALDYGGTKNTCAAFVPNGNGGYQLDALARRASPPNPDAAYDYATMLELAREVAKGRTPNAVGVSFGGPVRASEGLVVLSHHVAGWEEIPLRERLQAEFQTRVEMDNDANAAALGETRFGAGKHCTSVLYVTISTGVGGGWVLDGKIYRGVNELAGEIGHVVIDPEGPPCVCGRRGCLEQLACGPAIARMARERLNEEPEGGAILRGLIENDPERVTGALVNRAALAGDVLASEVMAVAASALGFALGNVICLMNPKRIILGGGVSNAGEEYLGIVRDAARANVMPQLVDAVDIVHAGLGNDSPLWGALALVT